MAQDGRAMSECLAFCNPYPSGGFVVCLSGCMDEGTSADVGDITEFEIGGGVPGAGGAMTCALLHALQQSNEQCGFTTYARLLKRMRAFLQAHNYKQRPVLSTNVNFCVNLHVFNIHKQISVKNFRALQVGVSYVNTPNFLAGTLNDIRRMQAFMVENGFSKENFRVLMDDGRHEQPTRSNIVAAIQDLVGSSQEGDTLFFQYSGHGGEVPGVSTITRKQTIYPCDLQQIPDTELHVMLVDNLPKGVKLICLFDSCHSASVMNLPYFHKYIDYESKVEEIVDGLKAGVLGAIKRQDQ